MERNRLVEFNGTMYVLVRTIKESQVNNNMEGLKAWRDKLNCDHVIKHDGHFLMVRTVEDIKWEEV